MKKTRRRVQIWRGLVAVFMSVFILMVGVSQLAIANETDVNGLLGTSSTKLANLDDSKADTEYFKKKTASLDEHMSQKLGLVEDLVAEGSVLLKNNGVLPLKSEKNITLLGRASVDLVYNGASGAGIIGNEGVDAINYTLKKGLEDAGFSVNKTMWDFYKSKTGSDAGKYHRDYSEGESGFTTGEVPLSEYPLDKGYTKYGDAAIVVFARNAGEGHDAPSGAFADGTGYYNLQEKELEVIAEAKTVSDKVIVIINSPSPLSVDELERDPDIDAILMVGGVGARGTSAIGKILNGTVNPSGHLADIYSADSRSSAALQNSGNYKFANAAAITTASPNGEQEGNTSYVVQTEGIYIGYRYYETRYEDNILGEGNANSSVGIYKSQGGQWNYADEVTYGFGYGLSYTTFTQELMDLTVDDSVVTAQVKVKNTGTVPGKDAVQLYVQSPYTQYDKQNKVEKSAIQLVTFGKTGLLEPGVEETVTLKMDLYTICSYDYTDKDTWILEDGRYYFAIGNGAHDALNNVLAKKGMTTAQGMTADGNAAMVKEWDNSEFLLYNEPVFDKDGFVTEGGTFHKTPKVEIKNELEAADLNHWIDNAVTYLSRSDWQATWPVSYDNLTATDDMIKRLTFDGVYEPGSTDTSSIKMGANTGYQLSMMMGRSYDDENWDLILDQLLPEEMLALVAKNFGATEALPGIAYPGSMDNDGPSGPVSKYETKNDDGSTVFEGINKYSEIDTRMMPSQTVLSCTFNQHLAYEVGLSFSEDMFYTGLDSIWAPGIDLHRTPYSGRNFEYYSEDSMLSYIMGAQQVAGIQSNGGIAAPKHFAFNDQEDNRYGYSVFINEQAARENNLRAVEGAISVGGARNIMTALNRLGCDWVGANDILQNTILRDEMGFEGYVLTDNALMPYMYGRAIALGTDKFLLLPMVNREAELNKTTLQNDLRLLTSVREACKHILFTYVNSKAMNGVSMSAEVISVTPWWKSLLIWADVILGILAAACIGMYAVSQVKKRKEVK